MWIKQIIPEIITPPSLCSHRSLGLPLTLLSSSDIRKSLLFSLLNHPAYDTIVASLLIFADSSLLLIPPLWEYLACHWLPQVLKRKDYFSSVSSLLSHSSGKAYQHSTEIPEDALSGSVDEGWGRSSPHLSKQDHTACENLARRHTSVFTCSKIHTVHYFPHQMTTCHSWEMHKHPLTPKQHLTVVFVQLWTLRTIQSSWQWCSLNKWN